MKIDVLTLFPEFFSTLCEWSIIGRALEKKIVEIDSTNIRDFSKNKHKKVDDYPYGGGTGMVMGPEPIYDAINTVKSPKSRIIYLSPQGRKFDQELAKELAREDHLVLLCGHYEGIDNRIIEHYIDEEISIGDFVLTGGEIPAMVIIDAVVRLLPGVLRSEESYMEESHYHGLLEYPQYTRPREFMGHQVPDILLSGHHEKIDAWRKAQSLQSTFEKRPDLLDGIQLTKEEKEILSHIEKDMGDKK